MKVLWFANTPANGSEVLKEYGIRGGWLSSLDRKLSSKVDLSVAFYHARYFESFTHKNVLYIPICSKNWKLQIVRQNIFGHVIDKQDLPVYIEIIRKVKPDIIHIHGTENPFGCLLGNTDIPIVLSYQGSCPVYNHKYYSGIERKYGSQRGINLFSPYTWLINKSYNQRFKYSTLFRKSEERNLKSCRNIIGRTDWDRRITRILAPQSTYFHNDEVLRDLFYKYEWRRVFHKKIVVHSTVGDAFFKGFETLCQSIYALNNIGVEIEWRVAGISRNCLLDRVVKKKLKEKYPTKGLILLGSLDEQELIEKMLEADIYVMPSHIENSPNSLCEAMVMGMPCITTIAGGSSSLLKDKEEGLVIQDGDPWSMAGAIIELHQNPKMAFAYGRNARKRALERHNPDKIVNDLFAIYQQITN
jgi:glycosyltransferase involved in cell wall biosynthesis